EDLVFSRRDPQGLEASPIDDEWRLRGLNGRGRCRRGRLTAAHELEPEPDAEPGEDERDQPAIDLERVLDDEEAILDELEERDEGAPEHAKEESRLPHATTLARMTSSCHAPGEQGLRFRD